LMGGLHFAVHPVHNEAVASIVGRAESLAGLFALLAFWPYIWACRSTHTPLQVLGVICSVLLAGASMLSKEQGVAILAVLGVYDVLYVWRGLDGVLGLRFRSNMKPPSLPAPPSLSAFVRRAVLLGAGIVGLLAYRFHVMAWTQPTHSLDQNPAMFHPLFSARAMTYAYMQARHMWMLLFPWPMCIVWSGGEVGVVEEWSDARNLSTMALYATLCAGATLYGLLSGELRRTCLMGVSVVVLFFSPAMQVFFPVGFLLAERVLYLPSMGVSILCAGFQEQIVCSVWQFWKKAPSAQARRTFTGLLVAAAILGPTVPFAVMTVHRSADWGDEVRLWQTAVVVNPRNHNNFFSFGDSIMKDSARADEAEFYLRESIARSPDFYRAWNNLGTLLLGLSRLDEAEKVMTQALNYIPVDSKPYVPAFIITNLGNVQFQTRRYEEAEKSYRTAIGIWPAHRESNCNLAILLLHQGRPREAQEQLRVVHQVAPEYTQCQENFDTTKRNMQSG